MFWGIAIALVLVAFVLLALGWRGRRVGSAPHCRRCGFELSGLASAGVVASDVAVDATPDATPPPARCPECGAGLDGARAIARGEHKRRRLALTLGVLTLMGAIGMGSFAYATSRTNWNAHKPTWLLIFEARNLPRLTADAAAEELLARRDKGALNDDALKRLIDPSLFAQGNPQISWETSAWIALLDRAFAGSLVSDAQKERYIRQAIGELTCVLPGTTLPDRPWGAWNTGYWIHPVRGVNIVPNATISIAARLRAFRLDAAEIPLEEATARGNWNIPFRVFGTNDQTASIGRRSYSGGSLSGLSDSETERYKPPTPSLAPGMHHLEFDWEVHAWLSATGAYLSGPQTIDFSSSMTHWDVTLTHDLRAAPLDELVRQVRSGDPDIKAPELFASDPRFRSSAGNPPGPIIAGPGLVTGVSRPPYSVRLNLEPTTGKRPETSVVGAVLLRAGGRDWPVTDSTPGKEPVRPTRIEVLTSIPSGSWRGAWGMVAHGLGEFDRVDLVIVPDLEYAAERGVTGPVWAEELVIPGVPLDWTQVTGRADLTPETKAREEAEQTSGELQPDGAGVESPGEGSDGDSDGPD